MKTVIQSGGKGTRLRPYTMVLPKPLMPVGNTPVLEMLLKWLRRNGTSEVYITTGHLGHLIRSVCGNGSQWDMRISYTQEPQPLGTVGALSLMRDKLDSTFLMLNGDVLTDLNVKDFVAAHRQHGGLVTIAITRRSLQLEFGILEEDGHRVSSFREKPILTHMVSMGIYCMEPAVLDYIPNSVPFGFDDLMYALLTSGQAVHTFRHEGIWLDIGRVNDFQKAQDMAWNEDAPAYDCSPLALTTAA